MGGLAWIGMALSIVDRGHPYTAGHHSLFPPGEPTATPSTQPSPRLKSASPTATPASLFAALIEDCSTATRPATTLGKHRARGCW